MTKNTETTEPTDLCLCNGRGILPDNMAGKDIYSNLIMLRTGSRVTVSQTAKYIENPESVDWSKVYSWAAKCLLIPRLKNSNINMFGLSMLWNCFLDFAVEH